MRKSSKVVLVFSVIIILLVTSAIAYKFSMLKNQAQVNNNKQNNSSSEAPQFIPTPKWVTYNDNGVKFEIPSHFYIANHDNGIVEWRSNFGDFFMVLKSDTKPHMEPKIGQEFPLTSNRKIKVHYIDENKQIEIDGKTAQWYSFGCLTDCEYQMVSLKVNKQYYQLIFNVAGGGQKETFEQIIKTVKFSS